MSYIIEEILLTTKKVKLISKKKFARVVLDENFKTFVMHIIVLKVLIV